MTNPLPIPASAIEAAADALSRAEEEGGELSCEQAAGIALRALCEALGMEELLIVLREWRKHPALELFEDREKFPDTASLIARTDAALSRWFQNEPDA